MRHDDADASRLGWASAGAGSSIASSEIPLFPYEVLSGTSLIACPWISS